MLSLVRSQHACIERIRSAVRWAKRLVVLVGAPGQGKTVVIQDLVLRTPTNPLCLEGELISDRTDAVLRLVGLVGLRPEGSMHEMLARLQTKHSAGSEQGIPEIIVDDAHCLPDDVLQLFHELTAGAYGRRWSVLLVGEGPARFEIADTSANACALQCGDAAAMGSTGSGTGGVKNLPGSGVVEHPLECATAIWISAKATVAFSR